MTGSDSHKAQWPEWLKQAYKPECSLDKPAKTKPEPEAPFDPRAIGSDKRSGLIMFKTALSTALIALAVLAPAASAADEVKPPRQTDQAAPTCLTPPPPSTRRPRRPRGSPSSSSRRSRSCRSARRRRRRSRACDGKSRWPPRRGRLSRSAPTWPDRLMDFHGRSTG